MFSIDSGLSELCNRLCLTLAHSLWQVALVAAIAWMVSRTLAHRRTNAQYAIHLAALLLGLAAAPFTFLALGDSPARSAAAPLEQRAPVVAVPATPVARLGAPPVARAVRPPVVARTEQPTPPVAPRATKEPPARLDWSALSPWVVGAYALGVSLMLLRLLVSAVRAERLGASARSIDQGPLFDTLKELCRRMSLRVRPRLAAVDRIVTPKVVGLLRPAILVPPSALAGLSPAELEMVLAHELAHLRRHDLWANLVQRLCEAVLFYHPAAWWLSRRVSRLREYGCDEAACAAVGGSTDDSRVRYASALLRTVELERGEATSAELAALAAAGRSPSELRLRVARLFGEPLREPLGLSRSLLLAVTVAAGALCLTALADSQPGGRGRSEAKPPTERDGGVDSSAPGAATDASDPGDPSDTPAQLSGAIVLEDGSPSPVAGWLYSSVTSADGSHTSMNIQGRFADAFDCRVDPGTATLRFFPEEGFAPAFVGPFDLKPGEQRNDLKLVLTPGRRHEVKVWTDGYEPVEGATVTAHPLLAGSTNGPNLPQTTDSEGLIVMEHVAPDTRYAFRVEAPGYETLRTKPRRLLGEGPLSLWMVKAQPAGGLVRFPDGSPAPGTKIQEMAEAVDVRGVLHSTLPKLLATADIKGRFRLDSLRQDSSYVMLVEALDFNRTVTTSIDAGVTDTQIVLPERHDLVVRINGDLTPIPKHDGKPYLKIYQRFDVRFEERNTGVGTLLTDYATIEPTEYGGRAIHHGLAIDLRDDAPPQQVEVMLGQDESTKQIVDIERDSNRATFVEFHLGGGGEGDKSPKVEEAENDTVTITGSVTDELGKAVAGAKLVMAMPVRDNLDRRVESTSDSRGRFSLSIPRSWTALDNGGLVTTLWCYHPEKLIAATSVYQQVRRDSTDPIEIELGPRGDTAFVVKGSDGEPLAGAFVEPWHFLGAAMAYDIVPESLRKLIGERTDENGLAHLPAMPRDGFYTVQVTADGYGAQQLQLNDKASAPAVRTVVLRPAGRVVGRLFTEDQQALASAYLNSHQAHGRSLATVGRPTTTGATQPTLDADGSFEIAEFAEGPIDLVVLVDPSLTVRPRVPEKLEVFAGQTTSVAITFEPTVKLRGRVQTKRDARPVAGGLVSVRYGTLHQGDQVVTDADGRFEVNALPGQVRQQLIVRPDDYMSWVVDNAGWQNPVEVPEGVTEYDLPPLELIETEKQAGQLVDQNNRPIEGARVSAIDDNRVYAGARTGADGRFELSLPPDLVFKKYTVYLERGAPREEAVVVSNGPLVLRVDDRRERTAPPGGRGRSEAEPPAERDGGTDSSAPGAAADAFDPGRPGTFRLTVVGPEGNPVGNVGVEVRGISDFDAAQVRVGQLVEERQYGTALRADGEGRLEIDLGDAPPKRISLRIKEPEYGPYWASWNSTDHPDPIPAEHTAQLERGWSVGGVVVDRSGGPVAGAKVHPSIEFKKRPGDASQLAVGASVTTDSAGVWRYDSVPASYDTVTVSISHADYAHEIVNLARGVYEVAAAVTPTAPIEIGEGLSVAGRVTDAAGQPIAGATLRTQFVNDTRTATTDADGRYRLTGCEQKMARIVVSAPGMAMDLQTVRVEPGMAPVDFVLQEGGHVRVRVVDENGEGIPKARVFFQRWRGMIEYFEFDHVDQYTNDQGVWEWNEAPLDEFKADICRPNGMQLIEETLVARDEEYVFSPPRKLEISGKVVDAETGKPVKNLRVTPGRAAEYRSGVTWIDSEAYETDDGRYRVAFNRVSLTAMVRVEAPGYRAATTRSFKRDEGQVVEDIELERAESIESVVLTPSSKPATGANIAVGVAGSQIFLENGDIGNGQTYAQRLSTDEEGRFQLPARDDKFQLLIMHEAGFAHVKSAGGPIPDEISLTAWARVEGTFRVGAEPAPNVVLKLYGDAISSHGPDVPNIFTQNEATTGPGGEYAFERVFPGKGRVARNILVMVNEGATEVTSSSRVPAEFVAGETTQLDLGGSGRAVVGKLLPPEGHRERALWNFAMVYLKPGSPLPPAPEGPWESWKDSEEGKQWSADYQEWRAAKDAKPYFQASVGRDGRFRIDNAPPGDYVLSVRDLHFEGRLPGSLELRVTVPEGSVEDPPVELGDLRLESPDEP